MISHTIKNSSRMFRGTRIFQILWNLGSQIEARGSVKETEKSTTSDIDSGIMPVAS